MRSILTPGLAATRFPRMATALALALAFPIANPLRAAAADSIPPSIRRLDAAMQKLVDDGEVVAAQVAVSESDSTRFSAAYGTLAPGSSRRANKDTLFLIGSVSKPFAAACVMTLIEDPDVAIALDDPIARWLPAFRNPKLASGETAGRAPTVRELLCHRAGIYSQKRGMTRKQTSLIRDFRRDLETAVDGIAAEPLITEPGESYFYSGAGYCVLGRVAELAAGDSFERLLQVRLCAPLGLARTTYFPDRENGNIAAGFGAASLPHALGKNHKLPLIGGSLYSTAGEMARFARAILASKSSDSEDTLLTPASINAMASQPFPGQSYGLGWGLGLREPGNTAITLSHSGALLSSRALLRIDLESGRVATAAWTLGSTRGDSIAGKAVRAALDAVFASDD